MDDLFDRLPHLLVVADKLAFRHRYLPGVRPHGIGLARAPVCPGMGTDVLCELSALVVECGTAAGEEYAPLSTNGRPDRTAHFSRYMQERPFRLFCSSGLPFGAEKPLRSKFRSNISVSSTFMSESIFRISSSGFGIFLWLVIENMLLLQNAYYVGLRQS